jgi:Rps23 Pro-64 3,4-dihydroxylase Tpa1-like proline 4-hydroxylase
MLNAQLNVPALAEQFQRQKRRIVIRDVFEPAFADRVFTCLKDETPWGLAYFDGKPMVVDAAQTRAMDAPAQAALDATAAKGARFGFSYLYSCYPMLDAFLARRDPDLFLHRLLEFINSPAMLNFVRNVTGLPQIVRADAQATLFGPGHFLTLHNDYDPAKGRLVAYVLGFTKNWRADYGGMLQFMTETHDVEAGFLPHFNSLMMFSVPQLHAVTYVPPYAPVGRYSVTGWFQDATAVPAATKAKYGL